MARGSCVCDRVGHDRDNLASGSITDIQPRRELLIDRKVAGPHDGSRAGDIGGDEVLQGKLLPKGQRAQPELVPREAAHRPPVGWTTPAAVVEALVGPGAQIEARVITQAGFRKAAIGLWDGGGELEGGVGNHAPSSVASNPGSTRIHLEQDSRRAAVRMAETALAEIKIGSTSGR